MLPEYIHPKEFETFLDSQTGERGISEFLMNRPQILYWTMCGGGGGHCRYVLREFPLGSSYVADFVVLNSYSGIWEAMFIELEPVDANLYTRDNNPAKRLATAIKQVDDWAEYCSDHKDLVRADLVRWAKTKDILGYSGGKRPMNFSGDYLADPASYLKFSFYIFIGRRNAISQDHHRRKAAYSSRHSIEIASYDRMLDLSRIRYQDPSVWQRA